MLRRRKFTIGILMCAIAGIVFAAFTRGWGPRPFGRAAADFARMQAQGESLCVQFHGDAAFLVKDLVSSGEAGYRSDEPFIAASIIKIPILAVALRAVERGQRSLEERVTIRRRDICGGSGVLKAAQVPAEVSFAELLTLMVTRSDNTATNKVIEMLGMDLLRSEFTALDLRQTVLERKMMDFVSRRKGKENYTSAADIVSVLEGFYRRRLPHAEFALSILKEQQVDDRLPRYLPEEIPVAHKTGLERGVVHDAGIVFTAQGDYIICVLTGEVRNYRAAKKFIAEFSLFTYNLYN
ncbi:MAG: hypothetical protein GF333_06205 [Candidatus Omnitrophica bacterium]|nr:hypothetical protein [Candidatus Omnitrophota bacterium]